MLPDLAGLRTFAGIYYSEELETRYKLVIEDGKLKAMHKRHGAIELIPAWKDEFRGKAWFMPLVKFIRNEKGEITGFLVSQPRSRRSEERRVGKECVSRCRSGGSAYH